MPTRSEPFPARSRRAKTSRRTSRSLEVAANEQAAAFTARLRDTARCFQLPVHSACVRVRHTHTCNTKTSPNHLAVVAVVAVTPLEAACLLGLRSLRDASNRSKHLAVAVPSRSNSPATPGFWTVRERIEALGLPATGSLVGIVTITASDLYFRRFSTLSQVEKLELHRLAKQRRCAVLFPDSWLDLLDATIDRVYFKTPIPEGVA